MCKGNLKTKATYFFDLLLGPEIARAEQAQREKDQDGTSRTYLAWKGNRLTTAFKRLIFFSEIFHKKY